MSLTDLPLRTTPAIVPAVKASAVQSMAGHAWQFTDMYRLESGLIKIERTFEHLSDEPQSKFTLASRVRLPWGAEPRTLVPGSVYNGSPSSP